ncbi:MAG TPA: class I SAM-dependent methyltransferase [Reyranella sp.]|nr:class I SAM-dependent methyltransferase [Reyranella sp.]
MMRDLRLGLLAGLAVLVPGLLLFLLGLPDIVTVVVVIAIGVALVVAFGRRWHRQATSARAQQTTHLRSVIGLAASSGGMPVYWTEHAITPETVTLVLQLIAGLGLARVLELGSGLSTLTIAHALQRAGGGRVQSFDDDARWAGQTAASLKREGLDALAEVQVAPLKEIASGGRQSLWYDLPKMDPQARYDLVLVDGPPAWKGDPLARLPALYQLRQHLSEKGVLVLDDAMRGGEREIASRWQRDFPDLHFRMVDIGRGLFVVCVDKAALDLLP